MSIKLVMLKSGEDIITDVKEIKSNEEVVGYYFDNPLIVKMYQPEEPTVLNEEGSTRQYASKISVKFYPWIPLAEESKIPCSADWIVTIVKPQEQLIKLYEDKVNGRDKGDQSSIID